MTRPYLPRLVWPCAWLLLTLTLSIQASAQELPPPPTAASVLLQQQGSAGPIRLRQPTPTASPAVSNAASPRAGGYVPGEFEQFVQRLAGPPPMDAGDGQPSSGGATSAGVEVRRFGAELITGSFDDRGADFSPVVPGDYVVAPGDEILLTLWGSVDADLRLAVDRGGRISVPRVGTIQVAGVRSAELAGVIERRIAQVFKNFQLSVSLGQLRGVRVFVTGFVVRPGSYTVSALSTVVGALMRAGGPSAAGSFRRIQLKRGGSVVAHFDLYDLLLKGDRSADHIVQAGDVVHVDAVGTQVGVIGSVNRPSVVELAPSETVAHALRMAGGFSAVADRGRVAIERLQDRSSHRVAELSLPRDEGLPLSNGDVLRAISATEAVLSIQKQNKQVRVDGEVARPGDYLLPPDSTLLDALRAAGGLTPSAFVYGTQFTRVSVRATQQENYERALRDMETDFARTHGTQRVSSREQAASSEAQAAATSRLIERLRALKPSGRVVLQLTPGSVDLPQLVLEDGDRLYIPPRPTTVGVFGSVFNSGSYLYSDSRTLEEYLRLAGGPTKGADEGSIFVIRSNGQVVSGRQSGGDSWFGGSQIGSVRAEPGDTVFVPEEMDRTTFIQGAKDWTQILYQFGIGLAGIMSAIQ